MNLSIYLGCVLLELLTAVDIRMSQAADQIPGIGHIRSPLLRSVYNKMREDEKQKNNPHDNWYTVDLSKVPEEICAKFLQFNQDEETSQFLNQCYEKSDWLFTQLGHSFCKSVLGWFMSSTSINGLLKRGSMFVFSEDQLRQMLHIAPDWKGNGLLDLGAGDGMVTDIMAKFYNVVDTTEMSPTMVWRLKEKGFNVIPVDMWDNGAVTYDLIGCLNLLDRCDKPMKILQSIHRLLTPTGRAIVAVVLPFEPYVEFNSSDHKPIESLLIKGKTFEEQAASFITDVFQPLGFIVEHFTRLPYLCEGDLNQSFFVLNDAVFVLKLKDNG
ncbi:protein-L-histidine N-pros-methyltransferase-like [Mytilus californianus]|uniref:protein-L-histidine N-pros-methyltransferase-like n=1 Tax=Mytilus californianus TaxID=6549 RepID=UPI00224675AF|nr:protein-L-histidine N-pros-methyltransferase-like [Mytilus californianus]